LVDASLQLEQAMALQDVFTGAGLWIGMLDQKQFYVYMLANKMRRLYVGMTSDLERRVWEHRTKAIEGFTSRYNIDRLVWYETTNRAMDAATREREIKAWRREKKIALIEAENPGWDDLARDWWM
jgi:putative endonuclease